MANSCGSQAVRPDPSQMLDSARSRAERATGPKFAVGDVVTHSAFGEGEVLAIETANNNTVAKIFFAENDLGEVDGIDLADLTKIG